MSLPPCSNKRKWVRQLLPFAHISNDSLLGLYKRWTACRDWIRKTMVCLHTLQQFQKWLDAILDSPLAHIESTHHPPILAKIKINLEILSMATRWRKRATYSNDIFLLFFFLFRRRLFHRIYHCCSWRNINKSTKMWIFYVYMLGVQVMGLLHINGNNLAMI